MAGNTSTPLALLTELRPMAEEGEPITLVPIDEDGEPCGPPQTTWLEPEGRKLN